MKKKQQWHKHFTMLYETYKHTNTHAQHIDLNGKNNDVHLVYVLYIHMSTSYCLLYRHFEALAQSSVFISIGETDAGHKNRNTQTAHNYEKKKQKEYSREGRHSPNHTTKHLSILLKTTEKKIRIRIETLENGKKIK